MKRLFDLLSSEERRHVERSLDLSNVATEQVRLKSERAREFLSVSCYFGPDIEAQWAAAEPDVRRKVLSGLIWRASCILDKSSTAVMGLTRFSLGYGFKVEDTVVEGKQALVVVGEE